MIDNSTVRIFYSGCGLSGSHQSVSFIGQIATPTFDILTRPSEGWALKWTIKGEAVSLLISISEFLSWRFHENLDEIRADPRATHEIQFLSKLNGIVFMIDSQAARLEANIQHFQQLRSDLESVGRDWDEIPIVCQCNKVDLPDILSQSEFRKHFQKKNSVFVDSIAVDGTGVFEALESVLERCLDYRVNSEISGPRG